MMGDALVFVLGILLGVILAEVTEPYRRERNPYDRIKTRDPYAVEIKHAFTSDDGEEGRCNICGQSLGAIIHYRHGRRLTHGRPEGTE